MPIVEALVIPQLVTNITSLDVDLTPEFALASRSTAMVRSRMIDSQIAAIYQSVDPRGSSTSFCSICTACLAGLIGDPNSVA